MKKFFALSFGIIGAFLLIILYTKVGPRNENIIKIGYQPNVIYLPVFVAYEKGYFEDEKLDVNLQKFPSANEMMSSLKAKDIQITGMSSLSVVAREEDLNPGNLKLLTLEKFTPDHSPDAIVIQSDSSIKSISNLKGKTLGTWKGSTIKTYSEVILLNSGLDPKDVQTIPMGKDEMVDFFKLKKIDAAFTFEPWVTKLLIEANGKVLLKSPLSRFLLVSPQTIYPGGSTVLNSFAKKNKEIIYGFQRAYDRALSDIRNNWRNNLNILKKYSMIDDKTLNQMSKMDWVISDKNFTIEVQKLLDFYSKEGITESELNAENIIFIK